MIYFLLGSLTLFNSVFAGELEVKVTNIKSNQGQMMCALFKGPQGFPQENEMAMERKIELIQDKSVTCEFNNLDSGLYAIAIFHDINNNNELDTNRVGIPSEPFGFSNNPRIIFGPPNFKKSAITIKKDQKSSTTIFLKSL